MGNPFELIDTRLKNLEELILAIKHEVIPEIVKSIQSQKSQIVNIDGLLEARPFLAKSKQTIYNWTSAGKIPHSKRNGRPYFDLKEVDSWIMAEKQMTASDIQDEIEKHLKGLKK